MALAIYMRSPKLGSSGAYGVLRSRRRHRSTQQGLLELRTLDRVGLEGEIGLDRDFVARIVELILLRHFFGKRLHNKRFSLAGQALAHRRSRCSRVGKW